MTLNIIIATVICSLLAFNNKNFLDKTIFKPVLVSSGREWYRFFSSGFIHADFFHLLVNMFVLYSFGPPVEMRFEYLLGEAGSVMFLIYYVIGLAVSSLPTYYRNKNNYAYNSLGASGAVSAILFSYIIFEPWNKIYLYGIIGIPGILAGAAYLIYSSYMDKRGGDNINHNAHFWGAVYGFIFPITIKPIVFIYFIEQLLNVSI